MSFPLGPKTSAFAIPVQFATDAGATPGEAVTLLASAARTAPTAGTSGTAVDISSRRRAIVVLSVTNADTDALDTLDVYVDVSYDGVAYVNAIHFTQVIGTAAASTEYAVLDATAPGTSVVTATSDAAAGAVRPALFGQYIRTRYVLVNAVAADSSFTFGVKAFVQ